MNKRSIKLDTGADEHISSVPSIFSVYPSDYRSDLSLRSATGHNLNIVQVGRVNELIDDVFITDSHDAVGGTLLSGPKLQEQDCWLIDPPRSISPHIGMVVTDLQGKVRMLCDTDNVTVLEDMDRSKIQLLPPDLTKLLENHCIYEY